MTTLSICKRNAAVELGFLLLLVGVLLIPIYFISINVWSFQWTVENMPIVFLHFFVISVLLICVGFIVWIEMVDRVKILVGPDN